eukprot:CAMPEP_0115859402 /NCGR_PEP_ID=MMETSP0287-20121206/16597_1 /TAXON_ID=412157 /ORGANISM="Chrysochromulina rotalis, Strain UIO044" /LENGTH=169 /DNA_ID=CAMNT_0003313701 /DNA_START=53 /DNA_END=559 /DNA_ORIENTATION=-
MGTNNPSEEQMELVQSRIIEIAQSLTEEACMLEANGYFDEVGFDIEARGASLAAKIKEYCQNAEDLDPNIEDHPQPRRMARYLLENVEYDILEKPLSAELIASKPQVVSTVGGGDGATVFGLPRNIALGIAALLVLLFVVALYFALTPPSAGVDAMPTHAHHGGGGGGG